MIFTSSTGVTSSKFLLQAHIIEYICFWQVKQQLTQLEQPVLILQLKRSCIWKLLLKLQLKKQRYAANTITLSTPEKQEAKESALKKWKMASKQSLKHVHVDIGIKLFL